tara:strand:- start:1069 stop:2148 length:1080 start_codon:yes stop_codon:yes gene_type:complete
MDKILVTGAAGFIGSNFVRHWRHKYPADFIVALDLLTYAGNANNIREHFHEPNFEFIKGSICDQGLIDQIFNKHKISTIVHFAAESHVDRSITESDAFIDTNIMGTHNLLKIAKKHWIDNDQSEHLFHHVSTDEVYGTLLPQDPPFRESSCYAPNSPYASSKAASDHLVRAFHKTYGLQATTTNCSNNYGPFHFPEKLIPLCMLNILNGRPLPIYGDGKQIRDWLYVLDHCNGIELVIKNGVYGETYNIGGNNEWTNIDLVKFLCETVHEIFQESDKLPSKFPNSPCANDRDPKELISFVKDRPGHDARYAIDSSKINETLGFQPSLSFEEGLKLTVEWYLENENWWQSILDGSYRSVT